MGPMNPMGPQGPQYPPYQQPMGAGGYGYEFDAVQNATISSTSLWARILGIALIIVGAASLINCNIIQFILNLVIGIYFLSGASSLGMVVNTQGNDIAHMMTAIEKLGTAFKIRVIFTIVAVVLVLLLFVAAIAFFALASASR